MLLAWMAASLPGTEGLSHVASVRRNGEAQLAARAPRSCTSDWILRISEADDAWTASAVAADFLPCFALHSSRWPVSSRGCLHLPTGRRSSPGPIEAGDQVVGVPMDWLNRSLPFPMAAGSAAGHGDAPFVGPTAQGARSITETR